MPENVQQLGMFTQEELNKIAPPARKEELKQDHNKGKDPARAAARPSAPLVPVEKEPPKDRDRLVCYAGHQRRFDKSLSLEAIRVILEKDWPELSAERTTWHWAKEEEKPKVTPAVSPEEDKASAEAAAASPAGETEKEEEQEASLIKEKQDAALEVSQKESTKVDAQSEGETPSEAGVAVVEPGPVIVVPVVTAGKKNCEDVRGTRGFYWSISGMQKMPRPVQILGARDGLYEIRQTPVGTFSVRTREQPDLDEWREGFLMALPKIPKKLLRDIVGMFKLACPLEMLADICWDYRLGQYILSIPEQRTAKGSITYRRVAEPLGAKQVQVVSLHSHGLDAAVFSPTDDEDEKATGLYAVVGRLDKARPQITCRYSCGGQYRQIHPEEIFEEGVLDEAFLGLQTP